MKIAKIKQPGHGLSVSQALSLNEDKQLVALDPEDTDPYSHHMTFNRLILVREVIDNDNFEVFTLDEEVLQLDPSYKLEQLKEQLFLWERNLERSQNEVDIIKERIKLLESLI